MTQTISLSFFPQEKPPILLAQRPHGQQILEIFLNAKEALYGAIFQAGKSRIVPIKGLPVYLSIARLENASRVLKEGKLTWDGRSIIFSLRLVGGGDRSQEEVMPSLARGRPRPVAVIPHHAAASLHESPQSIPSSLKDYVERTELTHALKQRLLHDDFERGSALKACLLHGKGGMGKTELAISFARKCRGQFSCIWLFDFSNKNALHFEYQQLAAELNLVAIDNESPDNLRKRVHRKLQAEENKPWLFIFDNVEQPLQEGDYPVEGGSLLMTSQNKAVWEGEGELISVESFEPEEAAALVRTLMGNRSLFSLDALIEDWGCFPFAVHQVARYIASDPGMTIEKYREIFPDQMKSNVTPQQKYQKALDAVWQPAIEKLSQGNQVALDWLELCSYLAPTEIPEAILEASLRLRNIENIPVLASEIRIAIDRFSLAKYSVEAKSFSLHRLFQKVLRERDGREGNLAELTGFFIQNWSFEFEKTETWESSGKYFSHMSQVCEHLKEYPVNRAILFVRLGDYALKMHRNFNQAWSYLSEAEKVLRNSAHKHELIKALHGLGLVKSEMGDANSAIEFYNEALSLSEEDIFEAMCKNSLGEAYRIIGELKKAEKNHLRALEIREQFVEHPESVAKSYSNLGLVYRGLGKYDQAIEHFNKAVEIWRKTFGEPHPYIATAYKNLGDVYRDQERFAEAHQWFWQALEMRRKIFKETHPEVALAKTSFAVSLKDQVNANNLDETEKLLRESLQDLITAFGERHHEVGTCYTHLAIIKIEKRLYPEALKDFNLAYSIIKDAFGEQNIECGMILAAKVLAHHGLLDFDQAIECCEQADEVFKHVDGKSINIQNNRIQLGLLYRLKAESFYNKKKHVEALAFINKSLQVKEVINIQPLEYARTLDVRGTIYVALEQIDKAFDDFSNANGLFSKEAKVSGNAVIYKAWNQYNLGFSYSLKNKSNDALKRFEQAAKLFEESEGSASETALQLKSVIAKYRQTGKFNFS